jgi:hypothetical protein
MMRSTSIRWRLPLSYAAIALLTTLSLGAVLLTTLRSYYLQHELNYLNDNAQGISFELARMLQAGLPPGALEAQLKNFSFLSQTRVRLLDTDKQIVADSGEPQDRPQVAALSVEVEANSFGPGEMFTRPVEGAAIEALPEKEFASFIYLKRPNFLPEETLITRTLIITTNEAGMEVFHWREAQQLSGASAIAEESAPIPFPPDFISIVPAVRTPFDFGLNTEIALDGRRSDQIVSQPVYDDEGRLVWPGVGPLPAGWRCFWP